MKIESLTVQTAEAYATYRPGQIVGKVVLSGELGEQVIYLSPMAISRLFEVIAEDLVRLSQAQSLLVSPAVDEITGRALLSNELPISVKGELF